MVGTSVDLVVRDHLSHTECVGNRHRLGHGLKNVLSLVADMRGDQGVGAAQGFKHRLDFLRSSGLSRGVVKPGRDPDHTCIKSLLHQFLHFCDFGIVGRTIQILHRDGTQRRVSSQGGDINGRRCFFQCLEIFLECAVTLLGVIRHQIQGRHRIGASKWCKTDPAVTGDDGGRTLTDLGLHGGVGQHQTIVVRMHIDEPG